MRPNSAPVTIVNCFLGDTMVRVWTDVDTDAYRAEVERRFRMRTPAKSIIDVRWEDRVPRSEMRSWSRETLGLYAPEEIEEWTRENAVWYRKMARRVIRELDPESYKNEFIRNRQQVSGLEK